MLFPTLNIFCTFTSALPTVPNMAVFCSSLISPFPGTLLRYCLSHFQTVPVAPIITGITSVFTVHMRSISTVQSLYFRVFSAPLLITFLSPSCLLLLLLLLLLLVVMIILLPVKVKAKVTLEQATKAQRGSRCIALLFLLHRCCMWMGGQRYAPAALPPGKVRYQLYRRLGGPEGQSGVVRKMLPPPGSDPRTVKPVASRYTD